MAALHSHNIIAAMGIGCNSSTIVPKFCDDLRIPYGMMPTPVTTVAGPDPTMSPTASAAQRVSNTLQLTLFVCAQHDINASLPLASMSSVWLHYRAFLCSWLACFPHSPSRSLRTIFILH